MTLVAKIFRLGLGGAAATAVLLLCAGCGGIPAAALQLPPESSANRQRQTRTFDGITEPALLAASAAVQAGLGAVQGGLFGIAKAAALAKQAEAEETARVGNQW
jgi:hypothetical protein